MIGSKQLTITNWSAFLLIFLLFLIWHGAFESPLKPHEIERIIETF